MPAIQPCGYLAQPVMGSALTSRQVWSVPSKCNAEVQAESEPAARTEPLEIQQAIAALKVSSSHCRLTWLCPDVSSAEATACLPLGLNIGSQDSLLQLSQASL